MYKTYPVFLVFICTEYKLWGFFSINFCEYRYVIVCVKIYKQNFINFCFSLFRFCFFFLKKVIHSNHVICCNSRKKNIFRTLLFLYSIFPSLRNHLTWMSQSKTNWSYFSRPVFIRLYPCNSWGAIENTGNIIMATKYFYEFMSTVTWQLNGSFVVTVFSKGLKCHFSYTILLNFYLVGEVIDLNIYKLLTFLSGSLFMSTTFSNDGFSWVLITLFDAFLVKRSKDF